MSAAPRFARLGPESVDALLAIEQASFPHPWSRDAYQRELAGNRLAHYYGCYLGDTLVAFAGFWLVLDEAHITNVAVAPAFRRRYLGEWLLRRLFVEAQAQGARRLTLEVRAKNIPAIRLYEKLGFRSAGLRKAYYDAPPDDAVIMWWGDA